MRPLYASPAPERAGAYGMSFEYYLSGVQTSVQIIQHYRQPGNATSVRGRKARIAVDLKERFYEIPF